MDGSDTLELPVGMRFLPTDEELAVHYLFNRITGRPLSCSYVIKDCDVYGEEEPWEIWERFGGPFLTHEKEELFFFSPLKRCPGDSSKIIRNVGRNSGVWSQTEPDESFSSAEISWVQKRFCYDNVQLTEEGDRHGCWFMEEFSLKGQDDIVLCRLRDREFDVEDDVFAF